ncbi:MAG: class I SAM-dependent methyltransferase [Edaphobacter sp.]
MQTLPFSYETVRTHAEGGTAMNPASHLGVYLQCPRCKTGMDSLGCSECAFLMEIHDGIVHALRPERVAYYAQFIAEYEWIRAAEGRGSQSEDFYLALPYQDLSGRNSQQWKIRSKSYDYLATRVLNSLHDRGPVLDLGAGNCWMSFRLSLLGYDSVAVDLLINEHDGLGAAAHFDTRLPIPIPRFQAEATRLPFRDEQFEAIIFNASFHYSEDYEATLREALRCLKPAGMLIISDTPWYSREESGRRMVAERQAAFRQRFGTASDSVNSLEYLTDERLRTLEEKLSIKWTVHSPWYGWRWAMRPWIAKLRGRREPSRFRIYVARKHA